jgi:REP element-mobilizing transposase RayT
MAGTFTQLYIHIVFAVKGRQNLIHNSWKEELYKYMAGIIKTENQKPIIINGMPDHVHVFAGMNASKSISDLVRDIISNSSRFINEKQFVKGKFSWQEGYGAFSYSRSHINRLYQYIKNQEQHHKKKTFKEEFIELLEKFEIPYQQEYLFQWID